MHAADPLICAAVRREAPPWPYGDDAGALAAFHASADYHGVSGLLHDLPALPDWPAGAIKALRRQALLQAMWELRHEQVLSDALASLAAIGVRPVLFKGTALAYSLYPDPVLRARGDTDLIIPGEAKDRVHDTLVAGGFERAQAVSGDFISYQASYTLPAVGSGWHTLDLHWKINNSELLSRLFTYEELLAQAVPLTALCEHAMAASRVHALLLACMHRATHKQNPYYVDDVAYYDGDRLIWLYDIHLLALAMTPGDWSEFAELACKKGLRAVCLEGMRNATRCFHTPYPRTVLEALQADGAPEPAARYLEGSKRRQQWMDFGALRNWVDRLQFLRELLFPPAAYMRDKYVAAGSGWLPWLYFRRAVAGLAKGLGVGHFRP